MKKKIVLSLGLATAIFTGCGSSSSGGDNNTGTGYYIDSAISGVDYVCGKQKGKTGSNGSFTFEKGKDCTFSLGDMKLREVKADTLKDQIKVLEDNLAVATLLQTLDSDGNPDNDGIVISENILAELKAKNITALPTNQDDVAVIYEVIKNVEGYNGVLKTEEEVQAHLDSGSSSNLNPDSPSEDFIAITEDMLKGKIFYLAIPQIDDSVLYIKKVFSSDNSSSYTGQKIKIKNGNIEFNKPINISYNLIDGIQIVDSISPHFKVRLQSMDNEKWTFSKKIDTNSDGNYNKTVEIIWYLSKPSDYPSIL
jgi:hypothetical protein